MPSPLPEVLKGLERFEVGPDYDHPGFNEMSPQEDGRWVRLSDVTDALRGEEGESGPERFVQDRDDLREVIDRACEATHKGDSPDAIAAYIWSHVGPLIADLESDAAEGWREAKENAAIGYGAGHPHPGRTSHRPRRALPRPIHTSRSRFGASGGGELARRARASKGHPMTNQSTLHGDDGGEERRSLQVEVGPEQTDFIRSELCKDCPQSVNNDASCLELLTAAIATNRTLEAACLSAREDADHYLRGREEAREGEDEFKEQADHLEGELAFALRFLMERREEDALRGASAGAMVVAAIRGGDPLAVPHDLDDLDRCDRAYRAAPPSLQERMLPILEQHRASLRTDPHDPSPSDTEKRGTAERRFDKDDQIVWAAAQVGRLYTQRRERAAAVLNSAYPAIRQLVLEDADRSELPREKDGGGGDGELANASESELDPQKVRADWAAELREQRSEPAVSSPSELREALGAFLASFTHATRIDATEEDWADAYRKERAVRGALATEENQ